MMSKNSRKKRDYKKGIKWVMDNLNKASLDTYDATENKEAIVDEFLQNLIHNGLSLKIDYDKYSDCTQCTAIGSWENYPNSGYGCSSRSPDTYDALGLLAYKVVVLAQWELGQLDDDDIEQFIRG